MSDKFKITLLASKAALAELIATGLDKHATITGIEAVDAPRPEAPEIVPVQRRPHEITRKAPPVGSVKIKAPDLKALTVYRTIIECIKPGHSFNVADIHAEVCAGIGKQYKPYSRDRVSAHFTRLYHCKLIERVSGSTFAGYDYRYTDVVSDAEVENRIKAYGLASTAKRRVATAQKRNGWFNNLNTGSRRLDT